jgi:hypothetical protein
VRLGQLAHARVGGVDRRQDQVLEHADVVRVDDVLVELDLHQVERPVDGDGHHAATGLAVGRHLGDLFLSLGHVGLHLLRLPHQRAHVGHLGVRHRS